MKKYKWTIGACLAVLAAAGFMVWSTSQSHAADLGGDCCADLEERIAELEAVAVRKDSRRTKVIVTGRVSQAIVWTSYGDYDDYSVGENSNAPSFLGVKASYTISPNMTARAFAQIGLGGYEAGGFGYGHIEGDTHGLYTRQVGVSLEHKQMGSVTLGKTKQATDGISQLDRSRSWIASTPLSLRPITGPGLGEVLEMDGTRANVVRYDSPTMLGGLWFSGSIAASNIDPVTGTTDGTIWDVAARYWSTVGQFDVALGAGYREGIWIEDDSLAGIPLSLAVDGLPKVMSGSASVKHNPTGIFVNAMYGNTDLDAIPVEISGYSVKAGIEASWFKAAGKGFGPSDKSTTVFVEYGKWDLSDLMVDDVDYWGAGLVQNFGNVDVYVSGRNYSLWDEDAMVLMAGGTLTF